MCDFQDAVKLMAADALLAGHHQVNGLQPLVQRNVAFFKDRANAHSELLAALCALFEAVALDAFRVLLGCFGANASQRIDLAAVAAVRADRTIGPDDAFDMRKGCGFVVHVRLGQNGHFTSLNSMTSI